MWKYIPYTATKTNNSKAFYSCRKLLSFNCAINGVIGARRMGKTYAFRELLFRGFTDQGKKFVWMRDNDEARKKLAMNNGAKFFENWQTMDLPNMEGGQIKGETILINGKTAGYIQPSSTFQNYKGNEYSDIDTICYDEFIKELNRNKNANEAWEIINSLYTILSTRRNGRILMTANALDRGNSFLSFIGLEIQGYGFYVNRDKSICIHYADNHPEFTKQQKESIMGKLIEGTNFESNLFDSEFVGDSDLYFEKLPAKSKLFIIIDDLAIRIYKNEGMLYALEDYNRDSCNDRRYSYSVGSASKGVPYIGKMYKKWLTFHLENNLILFHNPFLRKIFLDNFKV